MKQYTTTYKTYNDNLRTIEVVARSISKAVEISEAWVKKNCYSVSGIQSTVFKQDIAAVQK